MKPTRLLITGLLVALVALFNGVGAEAKIGSVPLALQVMNGSTVYGPGGTGGLEFGRFDVLTRQYTPMAPAPPNVWSGWEPTVASSYGVATLLTTYTEADSRVVFTLQRISRGGTQKDLMSFTAEGGTCGQSLTPLEITSGGAVRAVVLFTRSSGSDCAVDTDRTHLLEFPVKGKTKRLWLPPKYAALLLGGRLQTSGRWATLESEVTGYEDYSGAMLLDLTARKKLRNLNPGQQFKTVTVRLGRDGVTLVNGWRESTRTTMLYSSPTARAKRLAISNKLSRSFLCGPYAAIYTDYHSGVFERLTIRDMKGKQRFSLAPPAGQYLSPQICSEKYLLVRDATLARGEEEGEEVNFGELRLISLRTGREAP